MWLIVLLMLVVACWRLLLVVGCAIGAFFACGGFGFNCGSVCFCVVFSRIVWVLVFGGVGVACGLLLG